VIVAAAVLAAVALAALLRGGEDGGRPGVPEVTVPAPPGKAGEGIEPFVDPFAYDPDRREEFERRAAAGNAHVLYALSPGGAEATARRVEKWRGPVEAAAKQAGVEPDLVEALVFLESGGREDALTPAGTGGAAGLTQIVAETGQNLLAMRVDVARSRRLTRRIDRELRRGRLLRVERLRAQRARVDERFDPRKALAATARYLTFARDRLGGSDELAFVSYHMGVGNLQGVLAAYGGEVGKVPYAQVYFDSTPLRHPQAQARLGRLGDDSSNYLWKLHAAREIMRLHRDDPPGLAAQARLQTAKGSAEEVLHPPSETPRFSSPAELRDAWDADEIVALPSRPDRTGLRLHRDMGELARRVDQRPELYRGLRPEALATALYIAALTRAIARDPRAATLTVSSTVRDGAYQRELIRGNPEATRNYSLHTTGYAFDVLRRYGSRRHALAFQFVLDRLQSLNLVAWVREPAAIHITASRDGEQLLPLLKRGESPP